MKRSKAIVTLATGARYLDQWKRLCEGNWRRYADLHGYDLICIDRPLDDSERARGRSPAWQKCLVLRERFAQDYERIVWIDADILINTTLAPSVVENVPLDKVGAVRAFSTPTRELFLQALERTYEYYVSRGLSLAPERSPEEYYSNYGLIPARNDEVVQTGVLVLSPSHHRALLERAYFNHEAKSEGEWEHRDAWGEMRALSFELLNADSVHWIDHRFNQGWVPYKLMHYPFLLNLEPKPGVINRIKRKIGKRFDAYSFETLLRGCANSAFVNSYFLHFAGSKSDMPLVDPKTVSWADCRL